MLSHWPLDSPINLNMQHPPHKPTLTLTVADTLYGVAVVAGGFAAFGIVTGGILALLVIGFWLFIFVSAPPREELTQAIKMAGVLLFALFLWTGCGK